MSLPTGDCAWPPSHLNLVTPKMAEWSAWYSGDPVGLRTVYQRNSQVPIDRLSQYRGGATGVLSRFWWGRPVGDLTKRHDQLHIPIGTDICQASADLLFSEPPTFKVKDQKTQDRLDDMAGDDLHSILAESAEVSAALGGVFLRVTWDTTVAPDGPFLTAVHADAAVPEFRWGRLVAVTFWRVLSAHDQIVTRHLERHETDEKGIGIILHGLYEGTTEMLGRLVPLASDPSCAGIAVDEYSSISTMSPGLAVVYVPNQRPQRRWRTDPVGANLGRSDLDGVEGLMDALDEVYSSWMRDVRLAKARLLVPEYMLENLGAGKGAQFDADREIFSPLSMPPSDGNEKQITAQQFAIRHVEHKATIDQLIGTILRTVGYSLDTFGEGTDTSLKTATEVIAKERRSYMTRDRKIRLWRPAIEEVLEKLLAVDAALFGNANDPEDLAVFFADAVQADIKSLAQTAQFLHTAQAASTKTLVAMQHPDWDEAAIDAEVELILNETGMAVPDPTTFTGGGLTGAPTLTDKTGAGMTGMNDKTNMA